MPRAPRIHDREYQLLRSLHSQKKGHAVGSPRNKLKTKPPAHGPEGALPQDGSQTQPLQLRCFTKLTFGCPLCDKTADSARNIYRHIRRKTDEIHKPYHSQLNATYCPKCSNSFDTYGSRKRHENTCKPGTFVTTTQRDIVQVMAEVHGHPQIEAETLEQSSNLGEMDWSNGEQKASPAQFLLVDADPTIPWEEADWLTVPQAKDPTDNDAHGRLVLGAEPSGVERTLAGDPTACKAFQNFSALTKPKSNFTADITADISPWVVDVPDIPWGQFWWDDEVNETSMPEAFLT